VFPGPSLMKCRSLQEFVSSSCPVFCTILVLARCRLLVPVLDTRGSISIAGDSQPDTMDSRDVEKDGFEHKAAASDSGSDHSHGFTPEEQKKIIQRVDRRLVVTLGLMYCVSLM